jgi:putative NADPH-quinone reductase
MAKRILLIDGHPDTDRARFVHALAETYIESARANGCETRLITVADIAVSFLRSAADFAVAPTEPAIVSAREDLVWAEHVVLVFPLWLGGAPALLRAFLEQVARGEFVAETSGAGIRQKLKGKSARLIVTMGMPSFIYRLLFHAHGVRNITQGILGFAGISPTAVTLFGGVEAASERTRGRWLALVARLGRDGA